MKTRFATGRPLPLQAPTAFVRIRPSSVRGCGEPRPGAWDRGGDEFVNHPPNAPTVSASKDTAQPGETLTIQFGLQTGAGCLASRVGKGV